MKAFAKNLIEGTGGLNFGFLNTCFTDTKQLCHNLEKHIHFQSTYIDEEREDEIQLTLDYASFMIHIKLDIVPSTCGISSYSKKINKITFVGATMVEKD